MENVSDPTFKTEYLTLKIKRSWMVLLRNSSADLRDQIWRGEKLYNCKTSHEAENVKMMHISQWQKNGITYHPECLNTVLHVCVCVCVCEKVYSVNILYTEW